MPNISEKVTTVSKEALSKESIKDVLIQLDEKGASENFYRYFKKSPGFITSNNLPDLMNQLKTKSDAKKNIEFHEVDVSIDGTEINAVVGDKGTYEVLEKIIKEKQIQEKKMLNKVARFSRETRLSAKELEELAKNNGLKSSLKFENVSPSVLNYIEVHSKKYDLKFCPASKKGFDSEGRSTESFDLYVVNDANRENEKKVYSLISEAASRFSDTRNSANGIQIGKELQRFAVQNNKESEQIRELISDPSSLKEPVSIICTERFKNNPEKHQKISMELTRKGLAIKEPGMRDRFIPTSEKDELVLEFYRTRERMKKITILEKKDRDKLERESKELHKKYTRNTRFENKSDADRYDEENRVIRNICEECNISSTLEAVNVVSMVKTLSALEQNGKPLLNMNDIQKKVEKSLDDKMLEDALKAPEDFLKVTDRDLYEDATLPNGRAVVNMDTLQKIVQITEEKETITKVGLISGIDEIAKNEAEKSEQEREEGFALAQR